MEPTDEEREQKVSVGLRHAEIGTFVIGSEGATVKVEHHYHGRDHREQKPLQKEDKSVGFEDPCEGYSPLTENIFMSETPIRSGAKVYRAYQRHADGSHRPLAVKVIFGCEENNFREVEHLVKLASHPNIVQIIQSKKQKRLCGHDLYIIMELCGDQDLMDYLDEIKQGGSSFDVERTMSFSRQILDGVKHIHQKNIVHRDLKPENILILPGREHLKLTDFGISKRLSHGRPGTKQTNLLGTDGFRAPETFAMGEITKKADIFSSGIILHMLWSNGKHPFGEKVESRNHNITTNVSPDFSGLKVSGRKKENLVNLICWMLKPEPKERPTVEEVFQHPFFKEDFGMANKLSEGKELPLDAVDLAISDSSATNEQYDPIEQPLAVIGIADVNSKTIQTLASRNKPWDTVHIIPEEISKLYFRTIAVDKVIFILATDRTSFKLDVMKLEEGWNELPERKENGFIQAVQLDGRVYAFHNRDKKSIAIEVLNTEHTAWSLLKKPAPFEDEAITTAEGHICTFGGNDGSVSQKSMNFDPSTGSWTNLPDMPTARYRAAAAELNSKIYVVGGESSSGALKTTECFDLASRSWMVLRPMNNQHTNFNAFVVGSKIYAVGSAFRPFVIEEYDTSTETWSDVTTLSEKKIPSKATFVLRL